MAAIPEDRSFGHIPALLAEGYGLIPNWCQALEQAFQADLQQDRATSRLPEEEHCSEPGTRVRSQP